MHFILSNLWALGDTVCLSAAVRDFALAYPQHKVSVIGHYASYWRNNPYVTEVVPPTATLLKMEYYQGMQRAKEGDPVHFATWFHKEFKRLAGLDVPVTKAGGDLHLTKHETRRLVDGRYWVVVAGGKTDLTAKWWVPHRWQEVVDKLLERGIHCVQSGANFSHHVHNKLARCVSAVGATDDVRDLFTLIKGAEGVICGVTGPMHLAAALEKPCVVLGGGREAPAWEAYVDNFGAFPVPVKVPHRFLHTIGVLDCAKAHGCWKAKTVATEAADLKTPKARNKLCTEPLRFPTYTVARCMDLITSDHVVEAVMSYYEDKGLPPVKVDREEAGPAKIKLPTTFGQPIVTSIERTQVFGEPVSQERVQMILPTPLGPPPKLLTTIANAETNKPPEEFKATDLLEDPAFSILDDPVFGGKVTICILSHGDQVEFFTRCIDHIINTVPERRREIRVALNQPTQRLVDAAVAYKGLIRFMTTASGDPLDPASRKKYPAMRHLLYDESYPIATKYIAWFDDDSYPIDKKWLIRLAECVIPNHREGARLFGKRCIHDLQIYNKPGHNPRTWFETASWWRGAPLKFRGSDRVGPNGSCIEFVAGWFWAASYDALVRAGVPDVRLRHNGGDITIGAQMMQAGFKVKDFNQTKQFVYTPPKLEGGRRGFSEPFQWADPASRDKHVCGT